MGLRMKRQDASHTLFAEGRRRFLKMVGPPIQILLGISLTGKVTASAVDYSDRVFGPAQEKSQFSMTYRLAWPGGRIFLVMAPGEHDCTLLPPPGLLARALPQCEGLRADRILDIWYTQLFPDDVVILATTEHDAGRLIFRGGCDILDCARSPKVEPLTIVLLGGEITSLSGYMTRTTHKIHTAEFFKDYIRDCSFPDAFIEHDGGLFACLGATLVRLLDIRDGKIVGLRRHLFRKAPLIAASPETANLNVPDTVGR